MYLQDDEERTQFFPPPISRKQSAEESTGRTCKPQKDMKDTKLLLFIFMLFCCLLSCLFPLFVFVFAALWDVLSYCTNN